MYDTPVCKVDTNAVTTWQLPGGFLHREDGPEMTSEDGARWWWLNGRLHRTDGPAAEWPDGAREWWVNGRRHRGDGPAIVCSNGEEFWWLLGRPADPGHGERWQAMAAEAHELAWALLEDWRAGLDELLDVAAALAAAPAAA